jgi:5-methyltetrahydrofolate--homocysteine methyltransferase
VAEAGSPEDIIVDPSCFCGTGDESYIGGAVETIEAIRLIKAHPVREST